jgi:hypothetical protein
MSSHHAGISANPIIGLCAAFGLACISNSAAAQVQSCTQTIESLNATKTAQVGYTHEQKQVLEKIEKLNKGEASFRQKLQTQQCRPTGAEDDAKEQQPSCEFLLKVILDAQKVRSAFEEQIADLQKKTTDAAGIEQNLVQQATLNGCPPYGTAPERKATAPESKPKKAVQRSQTQPGTRAQRRDNDDPSAGGQRGGMSIQFGRGGFGVGF